MKTLNLGLALLFACSSPNDPQPKVVSLPSAQTVFVSTTDTEAVAICKSSAPIKGICWGASVNPSVTDSWAEGDTVKFAVEPRKQYNIRAFARNGAGTAYGENVTFLSVCPSDIGGNITYSTVTPLCTTVTGTTIFAHQGDGIYLVGDASFGVYACAYSDSPSTGIKLEDTCGNLKFTGSDQYGIIFAFTVISRTSAALVIQWSNDFGDTGTSTLQRPGGW